MDIEERDADQNEDEAHSNRESRKRPRRESGSSESASSDSDGEDRAAAARKRRRLTNPAIGAFRAADQLINRPRGVPGGQIQAAAQGRALRSRAFVPNRPQI